MTDEIIINQNVFYNSESEEDDLKDANEYFELLEKRDYYNGLLTDPIYHKYDDSNYVNQLDIHDFNLSKFHYFHINIRSHNIRRTDITDEELREYRKVLIQALSKKYNPNILCCATEKSSLKNNHYHLLIRMDKMPYIKKFTKLVKGFQIFFMPIKDMEHFINTKKYIFKNVIKKLL